MTGHVCWQIELVVMVVVVCGVVVVVVVLLQPDSTRTPHTTLLLVCFPGLSILFFEYALTHVT